ncbi:ribokinase [Rhodobacteraceae bacterium KMM 6894]|nr:ribokinase [Rhodobacteraceae bacterium KMM 6894]
MNQEKAGTVYCLGSINADYSYRVPHMPRPGETLASESLTIGLGGKGANQSVAAARAGVSVVHIGAVGADGDWMRRALVQAGVDVGAVACVEGASGHGIILVDAGAENAIVVHGGANRLLTASQVEQALSHAGPGDWLMVQNETNCQVDAARVARGREVSVAYSAAPFDAEAARAMLPFTDLLILNSGEAVELSEALGCGPEAWPVPCVVITKGAEGAVWYQERAAPLHVPAIEVTPVDTTGAGDTFVGYAVAGLAEGMEVADALRRASAAAALMVTRMGTAAAIPTRDEVTAFLK